MYKYSNKIDRLVAILKRLDTKEQLTAELLAHDFHVTVRTIYRYMNHLQLAGYPVFFDKLTKSYRFLDDFSLKSEKTESGNDLLALHPINQVNGIAIATYRVNGDCIHRNSAMIRMTGCNDGDECCCNFRQLGWWRESGLLEMADEAIATGKEVCRDITLNLCNQERLIQAHLTPVQRDNSAYLVFLAQDLSPRRYKEMQAARFFAAINQAPSLILVTDPQGTIEHVGQRAFELTGYTPSELIGGNPRIFKSENTPPETYQNLWSTISRGFVWSGELCNRKKNGELYWQHLHIAPIRNNGGKISRYVGIIEDISLQKELEQEIYNYAITDRITSLYNRKIFLELGNRDMVAAQRYRRAMTLVLIDIDNFKQFNELYGYPTGNHILRSLADICRDSVRSSDLIGRLGKDSFGILLGESGLADAAVVAGRIRKRFYLVRDNVVEDESCCVLTICCVMLMSCHLNLEQWVMDAELVLRRKQAGVECSYKAVRFL
ncbi:MAG: diguanylate cyclase [Trichlorobacter sp.]|nr:diguanylate cyclase [Trichlorobacter sp.]